MVHGSTATGSVPLILASGVRPFWVWGSVLRGRSHISTHCKSHAESAALLADLMVGYWCRVGSLALTHTHNDIAILVQRRTLLSIFLLSLPPPVAPKLLAVFHP